MAIIDFNEINRKIDHDGNDITSFTIPYIPSDVEDEEIAKIEKELSKTYAV